MVYSIIMVNKYKYEFKTGSDSMKKKLNVANIVTSSRMVFAVLILFSTAFSVQFYIFYLLGGFTDMIDGTIARKLNIQSSFGSMLDSVADFVFVTAVGITVLSSLCVPVWVWIWIVIIALIKISNLISSLLMFHRLVPMHTVMNKITGIMLFLLPFIIGIELRQVTLAAVILTGFIATFAAVQEGHYIRTGRKI